MKTLLFKKSLVAGSYILLAWLFEILTFSVMGIGIVPQYWGIDVAITLLFGGIIFVIPNFILQFIVIVLLLLLQGCVGFLNTVLYTSSNMTFSINMLNLAKEVGGAFSGGFVKWYHYLFAAGLLLLLAGEMAGLILINRRIKVQIRHDWFRSFAVILVVFFLVENAGFAIYRMSHSSFEKAAASDTFYELNDDVGLYNTHLLALRAFRKFGSFGFYFMDVAMLLTEEETELSTQDTLDEFFSEGNMASSVYGDTIYTGKAKGQNVVLIVIESGEWYAINEEYTPTLYAMATQGISLTNYYCRDKTNHSEAIGILGSYPTQTAMTPSILGGTSLVNNSMTFSLPSILGNRGYNTSYFHANNADFYDRDLTHPHTYGFDAMYALEDMPALDGYYGKDSFHDLDLDSKIFQNYAAEYTSKGEKDRFFTMHMTLTAHGNYEDLVKYGDYLYLSEEKREEFSKRCTVHNLEGYYLLIDGYPKTFVPDTPAIDEDYLSDRTRFSEENAANIYLRYKRYQAGVTDLDVGVNSLLQDLEASGELDNTLFFFYADHSAYYDSQNYYLKQVEEGEFFNTRLYNIPCFLWTGKSMDLTTNALAVEGYEPVLHTAKIKSGLKPGVIDKFTCSFDVVPTLLHLLGVDFNTNLYHGNSAFSKEITTFVSRESGIFVDNFYYDGIDLYQKEDGVWEKYPYDETMYGDGFKRESYVFLQSAIGYFEKQNMLETMYNIDYFSLRDIEKIYANQNGTLQFLDEWK